jgi:L-asparagine transporter-like permease
MWFERRPNWAWQATKYLLVALFMLLCARLFGAMASGRSARSAK